MKKIKKLSKIILYSLIIVQLAGCSAEKKTEPAAVPQPTALQTPEQEAVSATPSPTPEPVKASEIISVEYLTTDYEMNESVTKKMTVYLPEGYSKDQKYNSAVLMHVSGCNETFWPSLGIKDVMDSLISNGEIEPALIFMPDGYVNDEKRTHRNDGTIYTQFALEVRNDLLPYIKSNYSILDDRNSMAFLGASFGAYMTVNSALCPNLDLFSNFGYIGGGTIDVERLQTSWAECGTSGYPVSMLYIGEGEYDDRGPAELSAINLKKYCDKFNDENLVFSLIPGAGHDSNEWITGFCEAMRLFYG